MLSADFYGPLPTGEYLIVVTDDYSRFPIVDIVYSTSARVVVPVLDKTFSIFGIPDKLKTDNGPPFQGSEFASFAKHMGFTHQKVMPVWPRANGMCERFMRNLGKVVQGARTENKPWRQELYKFLRNYRVTPHSTTGKSPAYALLGRETKVKFPITMEERREDHDMRERDAQQETKMKEYADQRRCTAQSDINPGDVVLVKQPKPIKTTTPYDSNPYVVTRM